MVKVLLVDDDSLLRNLFGKRLQHVGYNVEFAKDGQEGLEVAEQFRPNIIILDYQMPKMNGDEMLGILRETDWGEAIPVMMISAAPSLMELKNIGVADAIMYKPITNREMLETIEELLENAQVA